MIRVNGYDHIKYDIGSFIKIFLFQLISDESATYFRELGIQNAIIVLDNARIHKTQLYFCKVMNYLCPQNLAAVRI
jgi:hypothetical protein